MNLYELMSVIPFYAGKDKIKNLTIQNIKIDHREVEEGDLFVCIKGFTVDGHDFAKKAVANGAIAILAERKIPHLSVPILIVKDTTRTLAQISAKFFDYPSTKFPLIGITGTNGKTTVTYLLETIFRTYKLQTGLMGTIQMKINDQSYPLVNTTPNSLVIQESLHRMVENNIDIAMMEVSSHALDLGRVFGCEFHTAVFTNLSQDHLDYHRDMNDYLRAKSLLFAQLGNGYAPNEAKYAVINKDDPHHNYLTKSTSQTILTYGIENDAEIMATNIELHAEGTSFILHTPVGTATIKSQLIGYFNISNMLAAVGAALAQNVPLTVIKEALESIQGVDGRFERVDAGQDFGVIVDYAHTPDSLKNVLSTMEEFAEGKIYVVVGCGGDRDRTKRPLMAEVSVKYADFAIFTTDNPRTEDPKQILNDMTANLHQKNYKVIMDRKEAIHYAIQLAEPNDLILIAGKGHETYQEINRVRYDFDDRIVAKEAILARGE